ncbi:810_t:CDS:1, partial [Gigaspora margarita]
KTIAEKIRKNMAIYLQDLDQKEPKDFILPPEIPGGNWNKKLAYLCQEILNLNMQGKSNSKS